ncbi:MAG: 3-oxoacyl-ACP reductase FabG [Lachnospiraceae bacterium]|nr:3-oxoacyl-ACP reductase FabG [Lachnospiraceae bacterium]
MIKGKVAIVTGASRGIGKETAIALGKKGAIVIVNYKDQKPLADDVVMTIIAAGGKAECYACDVSDYNAVKEMIDYTVDKYGSIDILVNNAGVTMDKKIVDTTEEDYSAVMDTNLKGTFNCMQYAAKYMIKQKRGKIINISSSVMNNLLGNKGQAVFVASKAGVVGLTKSAASELGEYGITVNAVSPGFIQTEMVDELHLKAGAKESIIERTSLNRPGQARDIAGLVAYIASDKADYITGQEIVVDGGMNV